MLLPLHRAIHATATQSSHILAVLDFCRHHCHCHTEQSYFGCARFLPSPLPLPHRRYGVALCPFLPLQSSDTSCFALEVFIFFFLFNKTPRLSSYRGDAFFPPARFHAVNFPIGTYTSPPHPPPPTHTQKDVYNEPCDI